MNTLQVKRGDVFYARLDPVVGSETGKTRPVLVIQNDIGNTHSPTIIVAVISEYTEKKASYPICVAVREKDSDLKKDSVVNLSQIRTIDKRRLVAPRLGTLSGEHMAKVNIALKNSLALV